MYTHTPWTDIIYVLRIIYIHYDSDLLFDVLACTKSFTYDVKYITNKTIK